MSDGARADTVVLVVVWVLPVLGAAGLLAAAGLPALAAALLAVEAVVAACVHLARRRPERPRRATPPWLVGVAMAMVLVAVLGVTVLAGALG